MKYGSFLNNTLGLIAVIIFWASLIVIAAVVQR